MVVWSHLPPEREAHNTDCMNSSEFGHVPGFPCAMAEAAAQQAAAVAHAHGIRRDV